MFVFILLFRLKLSDDDFTLNTMLTKQGVDLSPLDLYPNIKKVVTLVADPKSKISDLVNSLSSITGSNFDVIKKEYTESIIPKYISNKTALTDIITNDVIPNTVIDSVLTYWTHFAKIVKLLGYNDKKVKSLLEAIKENNKDYTVEDALNAFDLPTGYIYYILEAFDNVMNKEGYTVGDVPPHFFVKADDLLEAFKELKSILSDDHITLVELVKELEALIQTEATALYGLRKIFGKTVYLILSPIVKMMPKSSSDVKSFVNDIIELYDGVIADSKVPMGIRENLKEYNFVIDLLRASLQTKVIQLPPDVNSFAENILPYLDSSVPLFFNFIKQTEIDQFFGMNSLPYVIAKGNIPIVYAIITTFLNEQVTTSNVQNTVENIRSMMKENIDVAQNIKTDVVNYLYHYSQYVTFLDPKMEINELVKAAGLEPYDTDTIKDAIDALADLIEKYQSVSSYSTAVADKLKEIKGIIKSDTKVIDVIKLLPGGDFISSFLSCASTIDPEANETLEQKASHFNDLVAFGIKVIPTLNAWVSLEDATIPKMINAVVTTTNEGKEFINKITKALNDFDSKGSTFSGNDIEKIFGKDYTNLAGFIRDATKIPYSNTATVLFYSTLVNFTETIDSLYSLALEASSTGTIKYGTIGEAGSQISNQNKKLNKEFNSKGLSGGAIFGIVFVVLVVIGVACFAVWFFVFRGQKQEDDKSGTPQITLV